jgi:cyclic beta-1,2-glucan synthetase
MLNPINHARTFADVERYKVEPFVVAADVYTRAPHDGRGGWTWYTGSAAWMYRLGLDSILGVRPHGSRLAIAPCIPASWSGFVVRLKHGRTRYEIEVQNPDHCQHGVAAATLDGVAVDPDAIPLANDGAEHHVRVVMGERTAAAARTSERGMAARDR